jgi:proline iminopeptidase
VSDETITALSFLADEGYDVYFYDQVGGGLSNRLKNINEYTVQRHVNDLSEIVNKIGATKVVLIGQSWGAVLATFFAAENAEKIDKIIFTSPGPIYPINSELAKQVPPDSVQLKEPFYSNSQGNKKMNNLRTKAMSFFATTFNTKIASDKEADNFTTLLSYEVNKSTVCDTAKILSMRAGSGFYSSVMTFNRLSKVKDNREKLSKTNFPALILKGECDNIKWGFTKEYLDIFKNHQFKLIKNAGHFIFVEERKVYEDAIKSFLLK